MGKEQIVITRDSLELALVEKYNLIKKAYSWLAPLGIFSSLFLSAILSDYKQAFYLSADTWKGIIWLTCLLSFIWLVVSWIKNRNIPSIKDVVEAVIRRSMKADYTSIFVVLNTFDDGIIRLLVSKNQAWNSYFLPHSYYLPTLSIYDQLSNMSLILSSHLGLKIKSGDVLIEYVDSDLSSIKKSMKHNEHKQFNFKFFRMNQSAVDRVLKVNEKSLDFVIDGTQYHWKSLNEISSDEGTSKHNDDVISHIKRNLLKFQ